MPDLYIKEGDSYVAYTGPKLVPETDVQAAKSSLETQLGQVRSELTDARQYADQNLQRALKAEGDLNKVNSEIGPIRAQAAQVESLTQQVQSLTTGKTELETRFLGQRRTELAQKFRMPQEKAAELESMNLDQLAQLEETLTKFGGVPAAPNNTSPPTRQAFDTGPSSASRGQGEQVSGRSLIKQGLTDPAYAGPPTN